MEVSYRPRGGRPWSDRRARSAVRAAELDPVLSILRCSPYANAECVRGQHLHDVQARVDRFLGVVAGVENREPGGLDRCDDVSTTGTITRSIAAVVLAGTARNSQQSGTDGRRDGSPHGR